MNSDSNGKITVDSVLKLRITVEVVNNEEKAPEKPGGNQATATEEAGFGLAPAEEIEVVPAYRWNGAM